MSFYQMNISRKNSCPYLNDDPSYKSLKNVFNELDIQKDVSNFKIAENEDDIYNAIFTEEDNNYYEEESIDIEKPADESHLYQKTNTSTKKLGENKIQNGIKNAKVINYKYQDIFIIKKDEKKKGIPRRGRFYKNNRKKISKKNYHSKYCDDNLRQRIKIRFLNSLEEFINKKHKKYFKLHFPKLKYKKLIQLMRRDKNKSTTNRNEIAFLSLKVWEYFSGTLSKRCKQHEPNYNKINMKKLMEKDEPKDLIDFLNKTIEEAYNDYIREDESKFPEFNLENDLAKIEDENENGESYKEKFRNHAKKFISSIKEKSLNK